MCPAVAKVIAVRNAQVSSDLLRAESNRRARNSPHATGAVCPSTDQPIHVVPDKLLDPVRSPDLHPGKRVKHRVRLVCPARHRIRVSICDGACFNVWRAACPSNPTQSRSCIFICAAPRRGRSALLTGAYVPWQRLQQLGRVAVGRWAWACLVLKARRAAKFRGVCSRPAQVPELDIAIGRARKERVSVHSKRTRGQRVRIPHLPLALLAQVKDGHFALLPTADQAHVSWRMQHAVPAFGVRCT